MKKILLDTNAYSCLLRGDQKVLEVLNRAEQVFFSVIVLAELYAGFKGGTREKENKQYLDGFLQKPSVEILPATQETSLIFAEVKSSLKKAGTPIPINDVWIAAHAFETGAWLITYDSHFSNVLGLRLWD